MVYNLLNKCYGEYNLTELSETEKTEDFEEFYDTIVTSVPMLKDVEQLYDISFENRKEYYLNEIRKTKNNFEYYCCLRAIARDIPSFHTDLCFPVYWNLEELNCYNSKETMQAIGMEAKINAWEQVIEEKIMVD